MSSIMYYVLNAVVSIEFCQTEFSRVFNFAILSCPQSLQKFDACKKCFTVSHLTSARLRECGGWCLVCCVNGFCNTVV